MRITVLGSSGGYPAPRMACSGFLFEGVSTRIWIDTGSGTLARLLGLTSLSDLDAVLCSHLHPDHWTDLPLAIHALRIGAAERATALPVYGPRGWVKAMGITVQWALDEPEPVFVPREIREGQALELDGLGVEPIRMTHSDVETFGFRVTEGKSIVAYSADSGPCEALVVLAAGADLFICEAGAPGSHESPLHLNARQAGEIAARAGCRRLILTHLRPGDDPVRAVAEASAIFGRGVEVALEGTVHIVGSPPDLTQ
jgi:ribonuclease BN (tRNA processing enzyme)